MKDGFIRRLKVDPLFLGANHENREKHSKTGKERRIQRNRVKQEKTEKKAPGNSRKQIKTVEQGKTDCEENRKNMG